MTEELFRDDAHLLCALVPHPVHVVKIEKKSARTRRVVLGFGPA